MAMMFVFVLIIIFFIILFSNDKNAKEKNDKDMKTKVENVRNNYDKYIDLTFGYSVPVGNNPCYIGFDNKNKIIKVQNLQNSVYGSYINDEFSIKYDKIVNVELIENDKSVLNIGNILTGGVIGGNTGAILGGLNKQEVCSNLKIKVQLNDFNTPYRMITLYNGGKKSIKKTDRNYEVLKNKAIEIIETIKYIISN